MKYGPAMHIDFGVFAEHEHQFFGMEDPYEFIAQEISEGLQRQVADTVVESIVAFDVPKFLTLGTRLPDDPDRMRVTGFAFCCRLEVVASTKKQRETLSVTFSACFHGISHPETAKSRVWIDLHHDALQAFDERHLEARFLEFRAQLGAPPS
ncbi:MAG: hypothetical protein AAGF12_14670 [Myxococcota bacterium]